MTLISITIILSSVYGVGFLTDMFLVDWLIANDKIKSYKETIVFYSWFAVYGHIKLIKKLKKKEQIIKNTKKSTKKYFVPKHIGGRLTITENYNFSLRWVKEQGMLYHLFRVRTFQQKEGNFNFLDSTNSILLTSIIDKAITWSRTEEGDMFWGDKHSELINHLRLCGKYNNEYIDIE